MSLPIRIVSDIHCDLVRDDQMDAHLGYVLSPKDEDPDTVLILAGDIFGYSKPDNYKYVIDAIEHRFRDIIIIAGNHEWYFVPYPEGSHAFKEYIAPLPHVHYLEGSAVVIDDIAFVGATLWTDFKGQQPLIMHNAARYMNDYQVGTSYQGHALRPQDVLSFHKAERLLLDKWLGFYVDMKKVVVTHHGCTELSIDPRFTGHGDANYYFVSNQFDLIERHKPLLWIHGHTHTSMDYTVDQTRVLCNPSGYRARHGNFYENETFDKDLVVRI